MIREGVLMESLADFLQHLQREYPGEILEIERPVSPESFQVTALLSHLEARGQFPLVLFRSPRCLPLIITITTRLLRDSCTKGPDVLGYSCFNATAGSNARVIVQRENPVQWPLS